jgi:hypothetical protein
VDNFFVDLSGNMPGVLVRGNYFLGNT